MDVIFYRYYVILVQYFQILGGIKNIMISANNVTYRVGKKALFEDVKY